jgi:hypothetical protein
VPWVGKSWLIQPKEIERLKKVGIDTNGLHSKLSAKRQATPKAKPVDVQKPAFAPPPTPKPVVQERDAKPKIVLSIEDTRFKSKPKLRKDSNTKTITKPIPEPIINPNTFHGKTLTKNEFNFIKWLQLWAKNNAQSGRTISGTCEQWHQRCKGLLSPAEIKNIFMYLRAKRFLVCDGCNTAFQVRNLDEFFTCAPIAGSALPKGYKYV